MIPEGEDVYDWCLTQAEIQGNINKVNGEQSWGSPPGLLQGFWWDQGMGRVVSTSGRSLRPSGKKGWVCISKEKLK